MNDKVRKLAKMFQKGHSINICYACRSVHEYFFGVQTVATLFLNDAKKV